MNIPKHIQNIYIAVLKEKIPLYKIMNNGACNKYNPNNPCAACFISRYIILEKK